MAACNCQQAMLLYCGVHGMTVCGQCVRLHQNCTFLQAEDPTGIPLVSEDGSSKPIVLSELAFLSPLRVLYPSKNHTCRSIPSSIGGNEPDQIVTPKCSSEYGDIPKITDGGTLTKVLTRANSLPVGGRSIQLLTDSGMMLLNCTSKGFKLERCSSILPWCSSTQPIIPLYSSNGSYKPVPHDTGRDKWRTYKFYAPHDPRKIFLFFATVSSLGTILLIYLTLTVNKISEGLSRF
ncbi:unnamed protein product [Victoria cruziana]